MSAATASVQIVTLEVLYWGMSIGGEHYSGRIKGYRDGKYTPMDVTCKLSAKQAKELNKKDESRGYSMHRPGDESKRFWDEVTLERHAVAIYKKAFPDAIALNVGGWSTCNAQRVLDGPEWFMKATNAIWQSDVKCGGYEGNTKKAESNYRKYQKLVQKLKANP